MDGGKRGWEGDACVIVTVIAEGAGRRVCSHTTPTHEWVTRATLKEASYSYNAPLTV